MNKTKKWNEYLLDYALYVILGLMIAGVPVAFQWRKTCCDCFGHWDADCDGGGAGLLLIGVPADGQRHRQ